MREPENIRAVERVGADWMGFILWSRSPRRLELVPDYLPSCRRVGVFVNPDDEGLLRWHEALGLDFIQLHGDETAERCRHIHDLLGLPVIKAVSVSGPGDLDRAERFRSADGVAYLLFDTKSPVRGGSGQQFDWDVLRLYRGELPFLLSGGIGRDDARRVCSFRHPRFAGVDVNSRFETAPGLKDLESLESFIHHIRRYEQNQQDIC